MLEGGKGKVEQIYFNFKHLFKFHIVSQQETLGIFDT